MKNKADKHFNGYLIAIVFFIAIIPLIVFMKIVPLTEIEMNSWIGEKEHTDFFSYYKSIMIMITGIVVILSLIIKKYNNSLSIKRVNYYIPLSIYTCFIILSTLLSKYKEISQNGFVDRYEGLYVLICYLALMFAAINFIENEWNIKILTISLLSSAVIVGIIGILQFVGADFFKSDIGKLLILPKEYHHLSDQLNFQFGKYTIYSTLYNTNFVGSYMAMLFPISFVLFLAAKNYKSRILLGLITFLMFANWIGCRSRAGVVGGILALALLIILFRKVILKNIVYFLGAAIVFGLIFISMNAISEGSLAGKYVSEITTQGNSNTVVNTNTGNVYLKNIRLEGKKLSIETTTESLDLLIKDDQLAFTDESGNQLAIKNEEGNVKILDTRYINYKITLLTNPNLIKIDLGSMTFNVAVQEDGFKMVGERGIIVDKIEQPEIFGFNGNEKFASMRGYIWSRSIPLLKNYLFIGSGPDTFALDFPQNDYVGKLRAFGTVNQIVDKPHNLYLDIGINTGVISLIAILVLFAMYFISSIKIYFKNNYEQPITYYGLAMFLAFCGYAAAGMFNDSIVSVAPVFWVVFGMGIACNYIIINVKPKEININKNKVQPVNNKTVSSGKGKK